MPGVDFGVATGAFWDSFWRVPWVSLLAAPVSFQDLIIESIRDWTGGKVILSLGFGSLLFSHDYLISFCIICHCLRFQSLWLFDKEN